MSAEAGKRKVLLSMQDDADAALLFDGVAWTPQQEPKKGEAVRFTGVPLQFIGEPFMVVFTPTRISGLQVESREPNLLFTTPTLAR